MSEIKIVTEDKEKEKEKVEVDDVRKALEKADEYEKLKAENDRLETEIRRNMELKAKMAIGGKAEAGIPEKSQEDKDKEEASKILSMFR